MAAESYERVLHAASAPDYGKDAKSQMTATFKMGQATVAMDNTRDTLLFLAGSRLRMLAPDRFEKFKDTLAKWKIDGPWVLARLANGTNGAPAPPARDRRHCLNAWARCAAFPPTRTVLA